MDKAIEVENLRRTFKGRAAVDGISFSVEQGEIFGFLGPNGAGKTTTIRVNSCPAADRPAWPATIARVRLRN
jgi:ABC-type multidrug transport system ATPase subunit